jgi:septum formation protein
MPERETRIILASASPRRADMLETLGVEFETAPSSVNERPHANEAPADYIIRLARAKVIDIARKRDSGLVIGADTIVVVDGKLLGKPEDRADAEHMLRQLSGRWHAVMTGVALYEAGTKREVVDYDKTLVRFAQISDREIDWYLDSGEPMDKAGAYAIQGKGSIFVEEIAGNYHNVVGLPIPLIYRLAKRLGYSFV